MTVPGLEELIRDLRRQSHYSQSDYDALRRRLGDRHLQLRLYRQLRLYGLHHPAGLRRLIRFRRRCYRQLICSGLWSVGRLESARQRARSPEVVEQSWEFPNLPEAFDGLRILQLSDFHFDFIPELPELLSPLLETLSFDLCVLTGDYRGETTGPYDESVAGLARLRPALGETVLAVLGNHDNAEILLAFPEMDIIGLCNEIWTLERGGRKLCVTGIDDPHYYKTHSFAGLDGEVREADFNLLLSHSPEAHAEAAVAGMDLQLSGHTHGGQICLPFGIPLQAHLRGCPRRMIKGKWRSGRLQGYTTRGAGSSSVDVRVWCPPEITVHTLHKRIGL